MTTALIIALTGFFCTSAQANDQLVTIEWGTTDTIIHNNQTLAVWIRVWNNRTSGVEVIPFPKEAYQLWAKSADTSYLLSSWLDGDNIYPSNSSVVSIKKIDAFGVLNGIRMRTPAKLVLRTSSPFVIIDSEKTTTLAPPENLDLERWFISANDLRKTNRFRTSTANSESNANEIILDRCKPLKMRLDSLEKKFISLGQLAGNARRMLDLYFCHQNDHLDDISATNWPEIQGIAQCEHLKKTHSSFAKTKCQESAQKFNKMISRLVEIQKQLPRDKYHRLKFQSAKGIVYLDRTSWYENESGRTP